ncbi:MAG: TPM domain-containing protein [Clostridiales bacterium]|nr:TPM domain-containing protein [Clostridiales bacterium]
MKKRLFIFLMAAVLLLSSAALGEEASSRVFDYAGLFSAADAEALEAAIVGFQESTGYDFAILVSGLNYGYDDYQSLCDDFYLSKSLGLGMNDTAILCYLDLYGDGYYYISVYGDLKNLMVNDNLQYLADNAIEYFYDDDFSGGFMWTMDFLSRALIRIGVDNPSWRVFDFAEILFDTDIETLEAAIAGFRALSGMDFLFLSTYDEMKDNENGEYATEFYFRHGFGDGVNRSGALIYLDLDLDTLYFNYYIRCFGDMDEYVSQEALDTILDSCAPLMDEGEILSAALQIIDDYAACFR